MTTKTMTPDTAALVSRMNAAGILARRRLTAKVGAAAVVRGTARLKTDGTRMTLGELAFVEGFDTYGRRHGVTNPEAFRAI